MEVVGAWGRSRGALAARPQPHCTPSPFGWPGSCSALQRRVRRGRQLSALKYFRCLSAAEGGAEHPAPPATSGCRSCPLPRGKKKHPDSGGLQGKEGSGAGRGRRWWDGDVRGAGTGWEGFVGLGVGDVALGTSTSAPPKGLSWGVQPCAHPCTASSLRRMRVPLFMGVTRPGVAHRGGSG